MKTEAGSASPPAPRREVNKREALREFHETVSHPDTDSLWLRPTLHNEEHKELIEALTALFPRLKCGCEVCAKQVPHALACVARELADVLYIAYGTAHVAGIDLDAAFAEVHRANMTKAREGIRRDDGKVIKPPGFVPPDMSRAIRPEGKALQPKPLPSLPGESRG